MRWLYAVISACGIVLAALAQRPLWFGLGVAVAVVFALVSAIAFAHERISGSARAEELDASELQQLREAMRRARTESDLHATPHRGTHDPR